MLYHSTMAVKRPQQGESVPQ